MAKRPKLFDVGGIQVEIRPPISTDGGLVFVARHVRGSAWFAVIPAICNEFDRSSSRAAPTPENPNRVQGLFGKPDLRGRGRHDEKPNRKALTVSRHHELRSLAALGLANRFPPFSPGRRSHPPPTASTVRIELKVRVPS